MAVLWADAKVSSLVGEMAVCSVVLSAQRAPKLVWMWAALMVVLKVFQSVVSLAGSMVPRWVDRWVALKVGQKVCSKAVEKAGGWVGELVER